MEEFAYSFFWVVIAPIIIAIAVWGVISKI